MPSATKTVFTSEGKKVFDKIVDIWPPIIKAQRSREIGAVEALSACGFEGVLHGLDERRQGIIVRHPKQLKKAFDAGAALAKHI